MRAATFQEQLLRGQIGESKIAHFLRSRGSWVLPAYEKEIDTGKGPRLFGTKQLVTPDLFVFPSMVFVEAKHKNVFSWHHHSQQWCTGIDLHHYKDYLEVQQQTARDVWLLFLHRSATPDTIDLNGRSDCRHCAAKDDGTCCPDKCPTGLFGASLRLLKKNEHHRHGGWGRHGMVYWAHGSLNKLAELDEVDLCAEAA